MRILGQRGRHHGQRGAPAVGGQHELVRRQGDACRLRHRDRQQPAFDAVRRPAVVRRRLPPQARRGDRRRRGVGATVADAVSGPQRPVVSAGANTGRIASHTVTLVGANNTGIASLVHCHYTVVAGTLRPLPKLSDAFSPAGSATTVTRLVVRRVPARAQVNLTCTGTGCPVLLGARCHRRRVLGQAVHRHPSAAADPAHDRARAAAVGRAAGERRAADGERDRGEHRRARVAVHDPRRAGACAPHRVSEARVLGAR